MKRSTKRPIFLQIILFSANGIYTMFTDNKMELMVFATGNIYRSTGTTSAALQDQDHQKLFPDEQGSRAAYCEELKLQGTHFNLNLLILLDYFKSLFFFYLQRR